MALYLLVSVGFIWTILTRGMRPCILGALPLVMLVLLSTVWSVDARSTLFYGTMFSMNMFAGYVISQIMAPSRFLRILANTLLFCLLSSYLLVVIMPEVSVGTRWGGGWVGGLQLRGVYAHKSDAGYYFALLFLLMLGGASIGLSKGKRIAAGTAALLTLPFTNSATGLVALGSMAALIFFVARLPRLRTLAIGTTAFVALVGSVLLPFVDLGSIPELLGRDADLTGRGPIWEAGKEFVAARPILGYGYYGFFNQDAFSPVWDLWGRSEYFFTPHFHNAALDLTVSVGLTGLMCYMVLIAFAFTTLANQTIPANVGTLLAVVLLVMLIAAAGDFTLMKHNHFSTFFAFYCFFAAQTRYTSLRR